MFSNISSNEPSNIDLRISLFITYFSSKEFISHLPNKNCLPPQIRL